MAANSQGKEPAQTAVQVAALRLNVGIDPNFKPYAYRDGAGKFVGLEVDVLNALAQKLRADVIFHEGSPEELKTKLAKKELQLVLAAIEPTFDLAYDFESAVYMYVPGVWLKRAKEGKEEPKKAGKPTVGLVTQLVMRDQLAKQSETLKLGRIRGYESLDTVILALQRQEVDMIPFEATQGKIIAERTPAEIMMVPAKELGIPIVGLILKGAEGPIAEIPKILAGFLRDGTSQKICRAWFGEQCPDAYK